MSESTIVPDGLPTRKINCEFSSVDLPRGRKVSVGIAVDSETKERCGYAIRFINNGVETRFCIEDDSMDALILLRENADRVRRESPFMSMVWKMIDVAEPTGEK